MIARPAVKTGNRVVEVNPVARTIGNRIVYEFAVEPEMFVVAREIGDTLLQYARIVTTRDGKPPGISRIIDNANYRFEIGERFCVVEISEEMVWVSLVKTETRGAKGAMSCQYIASRVPIASIKDKGLGRFLSAIMAGKERMSCQNCTHRHYVR